MTAAGTIPMSARDAEEAGSFTRFFCETNRRAFAFALQLAGNRDDAMDIVQEAYLRLHGRWAECERPDKAVAWLYTIVRNLAIDHLRWRARRAEAGIDDSLHASAQQGPEEDAARNQRMRRLWAAIAGLPPEQREILLLRDWHGLNYSEVAEVLGLSIGTVSSRIHHARQRVRAAMEGFL
jgi:RNA polymerase sigma-70 factor (ECF subfamily)